MNEMHYIIEEAKNYIKQAIDIFMDISVIYHIMDFGEIYYLLDINVTYNILDLNEFFMAVESEMNYIVMEMNRVALEINIVASIGVDTADPKIHQNLGWMRMICESIVHDARMIWAIQLFRSTGSAMLCMLPAAAQSRKMPKSLQPCQSISEYATTRRRRPLSC